MQFTVNKNVRLCLLPRTLSCLWPDTLAVIELAEVALMRHLVVDTDDSI